MTTKPKSTWGGAGRGQGPKSRNFVLCEIGKVLPARYADWAVSDLIRAGHKENSQLVIALCGYAKRIREAQAK